jgi:hypothetical protein
MKWKRDGVSKYIAVVLIDLFLKNVVFVEAIIEINLIK